MALNKHLEHGLINSKAFLFLGYFRIQFDSSIFFYHMQDNLILILVYVDDILITGANSTLMQKLLTKLNEKFSLKTLGSVNYFLGFEAHCNKSALYLN